MTDYPPNSMHKKFPLPQEPPEPYMVPLNPMPQVAQAPLGPIPQVPLGPVPCMVTCPSCGASISTNVKMQPGMHTHLMALLLCLVCVCCAFIPYVVDSCQNAEHYCPNCNAYLGTHKR